MSAATCPLLLLGDDADPAAAAIAERLAELALEVHRCSLTSLASALAGRTHAVLILACGSLRQAEAQYVQLHRRSDVLHGVEHRAIVLCGSEEAAAAADLCRRQIFDDYALWPTPTQDPGRLAFVVQRAGQELQSERSAPALAQGQRHLQQQLSAGAEAVEQASHRVDEGQRQLVQGLQELLQLLLAERPNAGSEGEGEPHWLNQCQALLQDAAAATALQPLRQWASTVRSEVGRDSGASQHRRPPSKAQLLVVDDDPLQCQVLTRVLAEDGYTIASALGGLPMFSLLRRLRPDLILLDVVMEDLDGLTALRRLKAMPFNQDIPVIMVTGKHERGLVKQCLEAGACDFVVKPFERDKLRRRIELALRPRG